jgi:hypothetical protein
MAWIRRFERREGRGRVQPSQVVGFVKIFDLPDGGLVIQIDTEGSTDRGNPGKQSQTIQMGREAAQELFEILKRTHGLS